MDDSNNQTPDLGQIFGRVQEFQQRFEELQRKLATETVEATAGGGMVKVVANGQRDVVSITIEREIVDPDELEMLQDLVTAAVNAALAKAERVMKEKMEASLGQMAGGMLPNLFNR
jgi:DNA-binding YbaB/EbfC family protein